MNPRSPTVNAKQNMVTDLRRRCSTFILHFFFIVCIVVVAEAVDGGESDANFANNIDLDILKELPIPKERIVGGKTVRQGAYPFFAQWMKGCGGSLIHDDVVLTAGHCLAERKDLTYDIYVGGHESATGYQRTIVDYVRHPRYVFHDDKAYDFLLLKLDRPIPNPQLVTLNQDPDYPYGDELFTVIGFGYMHEKGSKTAPYLQEVQVPHIPDCSPYYRENSVQEHVSFCAGHKDGGRDSCQADSGGALLNPKTNVQVGLVSWGRGCARADSPGVYARVSAVYSWIQHQICQISAMPPDHCVDLRVDVTMDDYPFETEWAILDSYGHEMVVVPRGDVRRRGLTTALLKVPAGKYRFYMSDEDGICCLYGQGGIALYSGPPTTKQKQLFEHNGRFAKELVVSFDLPLDGTANSVVNEQPQPSKPASTATTEASPANPNNQQAPNNQETNSQAPPAAPSNQNIVASPGSWVTFAPHNPANDPPNNEEPMLENFMESTTLRIEIFYDMHPQETGWFLVNTDTGEELYSSKYDSNRLIPSNADNAMKLVVQKFDGLEPGNYWFLIADSKMDGICCNAGEGSIRIVELKWYSQTTEAQRDHTTNTFVEERVIWHHNGRFSSYAESHFQI